ncbi:hypothetical protein [Xanthomonas campestris]|uniref:hypothetical protein n=1 Tax=Xanthomonas campestris TaxID=339 RepID=UPI002B234880|nr:hypothetical protein [Xanthomonas campestris]MEA9657856.1 hypothetical protein [Xanthomonas campestris pv. raphani]MEB1134457.1 hypothetical protein [Xanthomonas campestris pv. campestris]MEB2040842.1 hypothetical protein [Xanthomonas campestris pv. campestris]
MARKKDGGADDVTNFFAIQDIALWTSALTREGDYSPERHDGKCSIQTFKSLDPEMMKVSVDDDEEDHYLLRVLVKFGIRSVYQQDESSEIEVLYSVEATFGLEYFVIKPPTKDMFSQFVQYNCVHNAWPFWRQHVYETLRSASLPILPIPFFPGKKPVEKRKIKSSTPVRRSVEAESGD